MSTKKKSDFDLYQDLMKTIREQIENQIDKEYTEIKLQYLENIEYRLEAKRNETVKSILDSIDISMKKDVMDIAPVIQIKIIKNKD